jgi:3-oxoacyl-[acyl-carrier-protein] synthase-1
MLTPIYLCADNILTSLGLSTQENMSALYNQVSGIKYYEKLPISQLPICTSLINQHKLEEAFQKIGAQGIFTRLEKMLLVSASNALRHADIPADSNDTLFLFSTTKGNINLLEAPHNFEDERILLWRTAEIVSQFFNNPNTPITISNACISGVTAINTAASLLRAGHYKHAVVMGADIMSEFTPSGFQSFKAISAEPCKPFDKNRDGITLGEAAGTMILSTQPHTLAGKGSVTYLGGANTNDANHISGPSRTGDGLHLAIQQALAQAQKSAAEIQLLSAHGTATVYNDEMESKAFHLAGLNQVPVNSLKGYWGHTLGAAGIIESIATCHSMLDNTLVATLGYTEHGVSKPLNITTKTEEKVIQCALKTASGFGGSNAAAVFQKL